MQDRLELLSYRAYVTDSLQLAPQAKNLKARWIETLDNQPESDLDADEIAASVIIGAGLKIGGEPLNGRI